MPRPPGGLPDAWMELAPGLAEPSDLRITKRQWGAFHGTELDCSSGGAASRPSFSAASPRNLGVESTARQAFEHGYAVIVAEEATTSVSADMHQFSMTEILPRIGIVMGREAIMLGA